MKPRITDVKFNQIVSENHTSVLDTTIHTDVPLVKIKLRIREGLA